MNDYIAGTPLWTRMVAVLLWQLRSAVLLWYSTVHWQHSGNLGSTWWRHQMETFSALLAFCAGNSPVTGEFPAQRPVTWNFDVFFDLHLNKWLSKHSSRQSFEMPSCPLWRHCNVVHCQHSGKLGSNCLQMILVSDLTHLPSDKMATNLADDLFKCMFMNEKFCISILIWLKFVPRGPINNRVALV